jgi:hypothetical protein
LLDDDIGDNEYQSPLYSGLAVLGVHTQNGWQSALNYTPKLSAVVTVARMVVLYTAYRQRQEEIENRQAAASETREQASKHARTHFDRVRAMVQRFMTIIAFQGQPSPLDSILRLRAYGRAIRANTNADGVVSWHGDELLYGHTQFSMGALRMMVHGLVHQATLRLRQAVLLLDTDAEGAIKPGTTALPAIRWDKLVDNAAEAKVGWSFVNDPRNKEAFNGVDGAMWLLARVNREGALYKQFMPDSDGGGVQWNMARVQQYARAMGTMRRELAVVAHVTGGYPARGSELPTIQYKNGANGDIRGVFIEDGMVALVTMYNKTMGMSASAKVIYRYLPREVGELFVYYIWLAIPFWRIVVTDASQGTAIWGSPFLWEPLKDQAWAFPTKKKKKKKEKAAKRRGHKRGRGRSVSPSSSVIRRRTIMPITPTATPGTPRGPGQGQSPGPGTDNNDAISETAMFATSAASYSYLWEAETWGTDRLGRAIAKVALTHMGEKLGIMIWRHAVKAIYRRYIRDIYIMDIIERADRQGEGGEEEESGVVAMASKENIVAKQFGHKVHMGESIYGRAITESLHSTEAMRLGYRRVSREWHAFLLFDSVLQEAGRAGKRTTAGLRHVVHEAREVEERRWQALRQVDVQAQLEEMVRPGATFRSVQKPALETIMRQEGPVVVVMGTGAGKSMLFMLPARCAEGGLTVVVVPLVALRNNIKDRCDELGIECVE